MLRFQGTFSFRFVKVNFKVKVPLCKAQVSGVCGPGEKIKGPDITVGRGRPYSLYALLHRSQFVTKTYQLDNFDIYLVFWGLMGVKMPAFLPSARKHLPRTITLTSSAGAEENLAKLIGHDIQEHPRASRGLVSRL